MKIILLLIFIALISVACDVAFKVDSRPSQPEPKNDPRYCTVAVYVGDTQAYAALWADENGTIPMANPFTTHSRKYGPFYVKQGFYLVQVTGDCQ